MFAVECFLDESISLDSMLQQPEARSWAGLENSLLTVSESIASMDECDAQIRMTRPTLLKMRNRSATLVPLNRLPTEVVAHILLYLNLDRDAPDRYGSCKGREQSCIPLANLLSASQLTSRLVAAAPSVWSDLDLIIGRDHSNAHMRYASYGLKYSGQLPLHVRVFGGTAIGFEVESLGNLLAPHASRIESLELVYSSSIVTRWLLLHVFKNVQYTILKRLDILDGRDSGSPNFFGDHIEGILRSLQVVRVTGPLAFFNRPTSCSITVLKVSFLNFRVLIPTLEQLTIVLRACPELRVLTLMGFVLRSGHSGTTNRATLPKLELLDLRGVTTPSVVGLVSRMKIGSRNLTFSMSFDPTMTRGDALALRDFFKNSSVTRLCLNHRSSLDDVITRFPRNMFSDIQELVLEGKSRSSWSLDVRSFPSLQTLHLLSYNLPENIHNFNLTALRSRAVQNNLILYSDLRSDTDFPMQYRQYDTAFQDEDDFEWPCYKVCPHFCRLIEQIDRVGMTVICCYTSGM
ncbi:F-box-like domain protein [Ceratobasidium sp. AG-Ba]|nr:F-box-like domain protein [Ceratobasidium sp. AG-Ba]